MNKFTVNYFLPLFLIFPVTIAQAEGKIPKSVKPVISLEPGPVINPENSQYMEEKKAKIDKQTHQPLINVDTHHKAKTKSSAKNKHTVLN
ncbi:hypothetical protein GW643_17255 [Serratia marcescens]|uniref:hypothetical protein n=1 Tax=Serratia marcescens TaxID=615 RepID=UPI00137797AF|nr:hypothetical protein [Serratia marcescens]MBH3035808.1 hypothetical protein [Serratia marcescens]MBH3063799.1 hypothetical protein [Serratia marcescens]NCJ12118.1 hypothetical protein [Serratia marcescens]NDJ04674.1 hypothetical protein [Serratia marcescens]